MKWAFPISISILLWGLIGYIRFLAEGNLEKRSIDKKKISQMIDRVAICVPAHNEEQVIENTINSLKNLVSVNQIYVVSDGSVDKTASLARDQGSNVVELTPGEGKAGALEYLIRHFNLLVRYQFILIADADTVFDHEFLMRALPLFEDEKVAVVSAYAKTRWYQGVLPSRKMFYVAYRTRLWRVLQWFLTYGQTWNLTNVLPVIPGFASLYRSSILKKLKINVPGLAIEDFNMGFQLHKKKLGVIAYHPSIFATTQEPETITDYWNQVQRWNLGFFQTVKYWKIWPSFFWISLTIFMIEVILNSIFFFFVPIFIILLVGLYFTTQLPHFLISVGELINNYYLTLLEIFILVFFFDYLLSLYVALKDKKYMLAFYAFGFIFLRFVDALILLTTLPRAFFVKSTGRWESPTRIK